MAASKGRSRTGFFNASAPFRRTTAFFASASVAKPLLLKGAADSRWTAIPTPLRRDPSIRLVFCALGGWDTHVSEGGSSGHLASRLRPLGDGIAALALRLGGAWRETAVVVLSEFGHTAAGNGDGGTNHRHGNVIWVAGGGIAGGRV